MKKLIAILMAALIPFIGLGQLNAKDEVKYTPKKGYRLGYVQDSGWLKGAKVFELSQQFRDVKILESVNLSSFLPPDDNQLNLGACTGFGLSHAVYACLVKLNGKSCAVFSPLFIYYLEREMEGTIYQDAGAQIKDGIAVLMKYGVCSLKRWPYEPSKFTNRPNQLAFLDALKHVVIHAYRVNPKDGVSIKRANSAGYGVVFGALLGAGFEDLDGAHFVYTGRKNDKDLIGGHCMFEYGYTKEGDYLVRNQWGSVWGREDTCVFKKNVMESSDVSDAWVIDAVHSK